MRQALVVLSIVGLAISIVASLIMTTLLYRAKSEGSFLRYARWALENPLGPWRFVLRELAPDRRRRLLACWLGGVLVAIAAWAVIALVR
jgi:hypothetical protein